MEILTERARLHVQGVQRPIAADVTRRRDDGVVVTQALPFLRLDTPVTEGGRRSRIKRVTIAMDGDVPRLLLELRHDERAREDDTERSITPGVSSRPPRPDSTVPYELHARAPRPPIVISDPPPGPAPQPTRGRLASLWHRFVAAIAEALRPTSTRALGPGADQVQSS